MAAGRVKLPRSFYRQEDVVQASRNLIGKVICTHIENRFTSGMITETEAYCGRNDKACHANDGLRTRRTEVMYGPPGHAYVYLCYGIHHLFNIVTNREGLADAVLIRSIQPADGEPFILSRRDRETLKPDVSNGPGKLTQALGITTTEDGIDLLGNRIWIEDRGHSIPEIQIVASTRIGIDYAGSHAKRRWRFYLQNSPWVSRKQI